MKEELSTVEKYMDIIIEFAVKYVASRWSTPSLS